MPVAFRICPASSVLAADKKDVPKRKTSTVKKPHLTFIRYLLFAEKFYRFFCCYYNKKALKIQKSNCKIWGSKRFIANFYVVCYYSSYLYEV
jgi:hypothetical protein